jgi:CBS domain-containing membrane protein
MSFRRHGAAMAQHLLPALPPAKTTEALRASVGAFAGIGVCTLFSFLLPAPWALPLYLIAPLGASAVLIFAVPNSPLAQPWSAIIGNVVSGLVAVAVVMLAPQALAPALAVSLAILFMFLTRSLHPPGGAVALLAALERTTVLETGFAFALIPVGAMTLALVLVGIVFNRLSGRVYPFRLPSESGADKLRLGLSSAELAGLLKRFNQSPNMGIADLSRLLAAAEEEAAHHRFEALSCKDVMSTPLIKAHPDDPLELIAELFRSRALKSVPVVSPDGHAVGIIHERDIIEAITSPPQAGGSKASPISARQIMKTPESTAPASAPVGTLLNRFARNGVQTVIVTEDEIAIGILTRSDIIALLLSGAEDRAKA